MSAEHYEELVRRATKGDKVAMDELFAIAEDLLAQQRFQDAAKAFRDAAISYRISAFRNLAHGQAADGRAQWMASVRDIYANWIDQNPRGFRTLPREASGIEDDCIRRVVVEQLLTEKQFINLFRFLEDTLFELGMQFYSPGGSVQRCVIQLLGEAFGLYSADSGYLRRHAVRIALDQIADEVERRCCNRNAKLQMGVATGPAGHPEL